jgi:hypothetical protein
LFLGSITRRPTAARQIVTGLSPGKNPGNGPEIVKSNILSRFTGHWPRRYGQMADLFYGGNFLEPLSEFGDVKIILIIPAFFMSRPYGTLEIKENCIAINIKSRNRRHNFIQT